MGDLITSAKTKATEILSNASALGDVAFGVGYYQDFPEGDYGIPSDNPYELVTNITKDTAAVRNAVNSLSLGYGNDWPESNLYALSQVASSTGWREGSTRIVIWFGDAVGHDGDKDSAYPSRIGLQDTIAALKATGVIVEAVNVNRIYFDGCYCSMDEGGEAYPELHGQASAITAATGGKLFDGSDTTEIVSIIVNALKDAFASYTEVKLSLSETFSGLGVNISPVVITGSFDRSQERYFNFNMTYTGLEVGTYHFDISAKINDGVVAVASDTVEVAFQDCNGDWNGTAFADNCGICVEGNTGRAACVQDCNGEWGGNASVDSCGECVGGNTGKTACGQDCNGDWGGSASVDGCGQCVGGNTGKTACGQDCNGEWGGNALIDGCGECVGGNTGKVACGQDCNGDWGGTASVDSCGNCVGGNTGKTACGQDCNSDWGGTASVDSCGNCVGGNTGKTACGTFTDGIFIVENGIVKVDFLYDGGMYEGELGIFSLAGMQSLTPNSPEFIAEAVKRVLSNSEQGYIVISDRTQGARFSGQLGSGKEPNRNKGIYKGLKSCSMKAGDTFATVLVPNASFTALAQNPGTTDAAKRPIFSLASSNPEHEMYFGQIAKIKDGDEEFSNAVVYEDMLLSSGSDRDYNDLIVHFSGVTLSAPTLDNPELGFKEDWRKSQNPVIPHIEVSPPDPDTLWITVTLKSPADLFVYDPQGRVIGREGGNIPGATFETDADGHQIVSLPKLDSGEYRVVLRAIGEGGLCHLEVKGYKGNSELAAKEIPFTVGSHETFTTVISADDFLGSTVIDFGSPDVSVSESGELLIYDFNGDGRIDDADIARVSAIWNQCSGNSDYDPFFDLDNDGCITVLDIMKVAN